MEWNRLFIGDSGPGKSFDVCLKLSDTKFATIRWHYPRRGAWWFTSNKARYGTFRRNLGGSRWSFDLGYLSFVWEDLR